MDTSTQVHMCAHYVLHGLVLEAWLGWPGNEENTDTPIGINDNLEIVACILCTAWERVSVGEEGHVAVICEEQTAVTNFCTHWSIVCFHFYVDPKALTVPLSLRHWFLSIINIHHPRLTCYIFTQGFFALHTLTEIDIHIHINKW